MAVVYSKYLPNKGDGSGAFRESPRFVETWEVRVDAPPPTTSKTAILLAPGVAFGDAHPDVSSCKAMQWGISAADQVGLLWHVTVTYFVPIIEVNPANGLPLDVWTGNGENLRLPFFKDKDDKYLKNSAGDPIEGMEREWNVLGWSLVRSYSTLSAALTQMAAVKNRTNSDPWPFATISGGAPTAGVLSGAVDTWKVSVTNFQKKIIVTQTGGVFTAARYWEVTYNLDYDEKTWHCKPWDMGFNQLVDASGNPTGSGTRRATILGADGKPVRQPVALSNGVALTPGSDPVALDFDPYPKVAFWTVFGDPA